MTLVDRLNNEAAECLSGGNSLRADLIAALLQEAAREIGRLQRQADRLDQYDPTRRGDYFS